MPELVFLSSSKQKASSAKKNLAGLGIKAWIIENEADEDNEEHDMYEVWVANKYLPTHNLGTHVLARIKYATAIAKEKLVNVKEYLRGKNA